MTECPNSDNPNSGVEDLYPPGTIPVQRIDKLSSLCSLGQSPQMLTGVIRQILLQHFADASQISNDHLREILERDGVWSPGVNSGIYIESLARWRPELTEARPAILIKEGDWTWRRVGIGDLSGRDARSGQETFAGLWNGTHTIFAVGNEGAETQILAAEIAKLLVWYGPTITDQMNLHRWMVIKIGALAALKEATENYIAPVDVAYVAEEAWSLQVDAPRLKRIVFDAEELLGGL
jgi:hypothetical protein